MRTIHVPGTDLELKGLGFGTADAGLKWDGADADAIFEGYLAAGGNAIDTAHVYSDWVPGEIARSERVIGDWLKRSGKRNEIVLMSKGGHPRLDTMTVSRLSKEEVESDLNSSLEKLGTDHIDVYFYHRDDLNRTVEELIETMESFVKAGKIRYYGCSNWTTERMMKADAYCKEKGYRGFVANQVLYNIGSKYMGPYPDKTMVICDDEMLNYHAQSDNLLMPYMGICSGFFHILKAKGADAVKEMCYATPENMKIAEEIYALCEKKGYSITQALLGFFDVQKLPIFPLAAAGSQKHLADVAAAIATTFDAEDYKFFV